MARKDSFFCKINRGSHGLPFRTLPRFPCKNLMPGRLHPFWVQQDANWNVSAITQGANVQERYAYDPYGKPTFLDANWGTRASSA